jgi:hypothetical protein
MLNCYGGLKLALVRAAQAALPALAWAGLVASIRYAQPGSTSSSAALQVKASFGPGSTSSSASSGLGRTSRFHQLCKAGRHKQLSSSGLGRTSCFHQLCKAGQHKLSSAGLGRTSRLGGNKSPKALVMPQTFHALPWPEQLSFSHGNVFDLQ